MGRLDAPSYVNKTVQGFRPVFSLLGAQSLECFKHILWFESHGFHSRNENVFKVKIHCSIASKDYSKKKKGCLLAANKNDRNSC